MGEPTLSTSGLTAIVVAAAGYFTGDFGTILFCAIAGSFWPLGGAVTESRAKGAWLFIKLVMTALALTGFIAHSLEHHKAISHASFAVGPIAFFIAVLGDRWLRVFDAIANGAVAVVDSIFGGLAKKVSKFFGGSE